jgi:hypothetical protein
MCFLASSGLSVRRRHPSEIAPAWKNPSNLFAPEQPDQSVHFEVEVELPHFPDALQILDLLIDLLLPFDPEGINIQSDFFIFFVDPISGVPKTKQVIKQL